MTVDFDGFARLVHRALGDRDRRRRAAAAPSSSVSDGEVVARVVSPGPLSPRKGVNVTFARPELPAITEKDLADLEVAGEAGADFVALSFVRSAADIEQLRDAAATSWAAARA